MDHAGVRHSVAGLGYMHSQCMRWWQLCPFIIYSLLHSVYLHGGLSFIGATSINLSHVLFCLSVAYISFDLSIWYFKYLGTLLALKSCDVFFSVQEGSYDVLRKL